MIYIAWGLLILWVGFLAILKKLKLHFFFFLAGSIGSFCFAMYFGINKLQLYLSQHIAYVMQMIGNITGVCASHPEYSMITVYHKGEATSFFIDYENSGFVESCVYTCLLFFFPAYRIFEKVILSMMGMFYIFIANIIRVFFICLMLRIFGSFVFFISNTVFARVLFFFLTILLYFYVFTYTHIKRQKVGEAKHDKLP